jgi:hypothetical protein
MRTILTLVLFFGIYTVQAQYQQMQAQPDTTYYQSRFSKIDNILNVLREFRFQAYIQPEWQKADTAGITSFAGGNFPALANNRFILRRGRFKLSWQHEIVTKRGDSIKVGEFAFQFDASEKGFTAIKDFYGRLVDPWTGWFGIQGGIFLRPFGYETPAPPATHESPEFSRMNQTIFPNECELGEALVIESPRTFKPVYLRFDASLVNGEGIGVGSQTGTYQSRKDFIGRLIVGKTVNVNNIKFGINASGSYYNGGVMQTTNNVFEIQSVGGINEFVNVTKGTADTAQKLKADYKREYYGGHLQFNIDVKVSDKFSTTTMLRGEIIAGQQPGSSSSSQVPLGTGNAAPSSDLYIRKFMGEMAYVTQSFHHKVGKQTFHHDITFKLDIYDPNTKVSGTSILASHGYNTTDIKFTTLGFGYTFCPTPYFKLVVWYDKVMNESTGLAGIYATDYTKNNVLTIRTQFMIDTWWFDKKKTANNNVISRSY